MSQAEGSPSILLALIFTPRVSTLLSSSQRQVRFLSTSPASSGQHALAGAARLLPSSTYVRQSETFTNAARHPPAAGAPVGAFCACATTTEAAAQIRSIAPAATALAANILWLIGADILDAQEEEEEGQITAR